MSNNPFRRVGLGAVGLTLALTSMARPAAAQSSEDEAAARALFEQGKKLMDEGKYEEACPKFAEGNRLVSGIGVKFNLAECYERVGRLASAWAAFLDVAAASKAAGQVDREKVARRRAVALEPELLKLKIDVPAANRVQGLEIRRDGNLVGVGQWGVAIPADGGDHTISVSAPGRLPFEKVVKIAGEPGSVSAVEIPLLVIDPASRDKATNVVVARPREPRGNTQRIIGYSAGGAALVAAGVGTAFGLIAMNKYAQSGTYCYPNNQCLAEGTALRQDAISSGNISTIGFASAGILLVAGVIIVATAPSADVSSAAIRPTATGFVF
jgi:hypothetical protein